MPAECLPNIFTRSARSPRSARSTRSARSARFARSAPCGRLLGIAHTPITPLKIEWKIFIFAYEYKDYERNNV